MIGEMVVLVLAAYGFASLLVAWINRFSFFSAAPSQNTFTHYQVHACNSSHVLEAVIRRLILRSALEGKPIQISLVDYGSSDETSQIVQLFSRNYEYLVGQHFSRTDAHAISIDLRGS